MVDQRNQRRGRDDDRRGRGGTPFLSVRDPVFGEPKLLPDGAFEVGVSVLVLVGNQPPREDVSYQFLVDGTVRGNPQLLYAEGRASTKLTLSGKSPNVAIQLKWRHGTRLVPLRDMELPKLSRKLEVVSTAVQPFGFQIVLRRVGKNNKAEPGSISAYDWDPNPKREQDVRWRLMTWRQEAGEEFVMLTRSLLPKSRKVTFFLPDDNEVKAEVSIPALPQQAPSEGVAPVTTGEERRKPAYAAGERWMANILKSLERPQEPQPPPKQEPQSSPKPNFLKRITLKRLRVPSLRITRWIRGKP